MWGAGVGQTRGMATQVQTLNYIGGEFRAARSGAVDEVLDPATGEVIAEVASSDAADAADAVEAASAAFESWRKTTPRARFEMITKLADAIEADLPELKRLESLNVGKPVSIIDFEFDLTVDNFRFFAAAARFMEGRAGGEYLEDHPSFVRRDCSTWLSDLERAMPSAELVARDPAGRPLTDVRVLLDGTVVALSLIHI